MSDFIELEGVRVNNLKGVDVRIRRGILTVICGVSGSGKSSLAFDTLFAEGQRRYVETFSPYARQFLDRIERPAADRIEGIPPAIAIRQNARSQSSRSTVGTRTETLDYLRTLFARAGTVRCPDCDTRTKQFSPDTAADFLLQLHAGQRGMLTFSVPAGRGAEMLSLGYARGIFDGNTVPLEQLVDRQTAADGDGTIETKVTVIADRIRVSEDSHSRLSESIEQLFAVNDGCCEVLMESDAETAAAVMVDGRPWQQQTISRQPTCPSCQRQFATASAESLNFLSPVGACPTCEGTGQISGMRFEKVVPDDQLTLAQGAIQPWTTPAYVHEQQELLALAPGCGIPTNVPFAELTGHHRRLIHDGVPEQMFGGLRGFHRWLVKNRYKPGVSVFLNRWRSWLPCPDCGGSRLKGECGRLTLNGLTLYEATQLETGDLQEHMRQAIDSLPDDMRAALAVPIGQLQTRLEFLTACGLGYLSTDRSMKTLSAGEAQRVVLTSVLGSGLINTLYVLDEPTSGLSAQNTRQVIEACHTLTRHGNTVVVVEHDPQFIQSADEVIEIGPDAGDRGGEVVFQGPPERLQAQSSATAVCLLESDADRQTAQRTPAAWLTFRDVNCHNIRHLSGRLPLNVICAVTGVSGGGKSSLIVDALYPAICRRLGQVGTVDAIDSEASVDGCEQLAEVCLLDQSPLPRSRRSIPVTIVGVFDDIRKLMAATHEARKRNFKPGMFSFNSSRGGRCEVCEGVGQVTVEMQFLADIRTTCEACQGRRFRPDVLEVRYRDRSIHDILNMTVEDAFVFFSGQQRIQQRLNALRQAGLAYLRLGQPVATLSGGESQRVRIASLLAGVPLDDDAPVRTKPEGQGTLFLLDEPSTGLHLRDIDALMKCLNHLVEIGHSVVIIEHNQRVLKQADYRLEIGPGPGRQGGQIVSADMA
ncbi:MAG: excinuclease ABC subunit UvrA [Planctomycetaceae bacterium]|nr:excinuclease ABC subunit UvrA [Planctomycetaceae bacterium]